MSQMLHGESPQADVPEARPQRDADGLHCAICARRLGRTLCYLEETGDVPPPSQSWVLCKECNDAVKEQIAASPVRTPLRLRIAVGIVATDRTPAARRSRWGQLSDSTWTALLFWMFLLAMLVHLAIIVFVASIAGH